MSRAAIGALLATSAALSAHAMSDEIDADGDGRASFYELQSVYPELTEELFLQIDTNADGLLDDEELMIAIQTRMLPDIDTDV